MTPLVISILAILLWLLIYFWLADVRKITLIIENDEESFGDWTIFDGESDLNCSEGVLVSYRGGFLRNLERYAFRHNIKVTGVDIEVSDENQFDHSLFSLHNNNDIRHVLAGHLKSPWDTDRKKLQYRNDSDAWFEINSTSVMKGTIIPSDAEYSSWVKLTFHLKEPIKLRKILFS